VVVARAANRRTGTRVESVAGKLLICPKLWWAGEKRVGIAVVDAGRDRTPLSDRLAEDRVRTCQVEMAAVTGRSDTLHKLPWNVIISYCNATLQFLAPGYRPDFDGEQLRMTARTFISARHGMQPFDRRCSSTNILKKLQDTRNKYATEIDKEIKIFLRS